MPVLKQWLSKNAVSAVKTYLDDHPEGFSEYDLLKYLDEQGSYQRLDNNAGPALLLFQKHFLLFHILYSINMELVQNNQGSLQISPLQIKKLHFVEADTQIGQRDPLGEYYLDLSNLDSADENIVNDMLNGFWEKYLRNDKRGDALKVLGLNDPVSDREITMRYRKLVNIHHPDKGGDHDKIQEINEAYSLLVKA